MLSKGILKNQFDLPGHTHVRLSFTVNLIDNWYGEIVYLKVNMGNKDPLKEVF